MAKTIAVANQKGGVGKTTTTINFGALLAERGYRVLLVDFDSQGNLSIACGIENVDDLAECISSPIYQIIQGEEDENLLNIPVFKYRPCLDFIPSNVTLSSINMLLTQAMAREYILKKVLSPLQGSYDFILIDCAPSLGLDLINALTAADEVLIVSNPTRFSSIGTEQLLKTIAKVKNNINPALNVAGVLLNKVNRRTNFNRDLADVMRLVWSENVNVFLTEIGTSIRVDESQSVSQSIGEYEVDNKVAKAFSAFVDEYLGGVHDK